MTELQDDADDAVPSPAVEHDEALMELVSLLLSRNAFKFGQFNLKSGKSSHYWIDLGSLCAGHDIYTLGRIMTVALRHNFGDDTDVLLAASTSAIPLAVIASLYYGLYTGHPVEWGFIRPLELVIAGSTVGGRLGDQRKVVVIEDILTNPQNPRSTVASARSTGATVLGVCSLIDRMDRDRGKLVSTGLRKELATKIVSCTTSQELGAKLSTDAFTTEQLEAIRKNF